jgi:hypothetical protein
MFYFCKHKIENKMLTKMSQFTVDIFQKAATIPLGEFSCDKARIKIVPNCEMYITLPLLKYYAGICH